MEKTRMQWFEEAKANGAEWVDAAIRNATLEPLGEGRIYIKKTSLSSALSGAFVWITSPEGHEYWETIYQKIEQEEQANNHV